ncbi:MAG: hypothetical protein ACR2GL_02460 [Thermoleophilaceae bacterium]
MSSIAVRGLIGRRRLALAATVLALAAGVAAYHNPDVHHGVAGGALAGVCLGLAAIGSVGGALGMGSTTCRRRRVPRAPAPAAPAIRSAAPRARHGPCRLSLLCVSRR